MYKIYLNENLLSFAAPDEPVGDADTYPPGLETTKLLQKVQTAKHSAVISGDPAGEFARFARGLTLIEAAGGMVFNDRGEILMIYRNDRWDLPKGKMEPGEEPAVCALREINEECGVDGLSVESALTETYHIYRLAGKWILKHTYWYRVGQSGPSTLTPQTEEGITAVKWVDRTDAERYLQNTYSAVIDVFRAAGICGANMT